jgi:hypothetical protein
LLQAYQETPAIKEVVVAQCLKQEQGDYTVRIETLISKLKANNLGSATTINNLQAGFQKLLTVSPGGIPQIFVPSVENLDPKIKRPDNYIPTEANGEAVDFLVSGDDIPAAGDSYPGYVLDNNNNLIYSGMINEAFAWDHDVSVIGFEEVCSPENSFGHPADTVYNPTSYEPPTGTEEVRVDGRQEWGGIIQVTDMNGIEPWTQGKFEFKYYVNASGGTALKAKGFGKWRRKNFREEKWVHFQDFIGTWNLANWGPMQLERWTELDDQFGVKTTVSTNINPGQGWPSTTITHTFDIDDDDLGVANVQFTDPAGSSSPVTTYTLTHMNFRRETRQ